MAKMPVDRITIEGFKSIRKLENFELRPLNVLIGANGSGKSNFVSFFRMLNAIVTCRLREWVAREHADYLLHLGPKVTSALAARVWFGDFEYSFSLKRAAANGLVFSPEEFRFISSPDVGGGAQAGGSESIVCLIDRFAAIRTSMSEMNRNLLEGARDAMARWTEYHFHDTTNEAGIRSARPVRHDRYLHPDGSNLAAFLLRLRNEKPGLYSLIRDVIRQSVPFLDDFVLTPRTEGPDPLVMLEWRQRGSDYPFSPTQLSDGSLRFIALVTALMQPDPPKTILIDEPELGLHPGALSVIAGLLSSASASTQVIVSTQSALLVDEFEPEDVIVVEREDGASTFRRLEKAPLAGWLERYSLGELWQKNTFGGGPKHE